MNSVTGCMHADALTESHQLDAEQRKPYELAFDQRRKRINGIPQ